MNKFVHFLFQCKILYFKVTSGDTIIIRGQPVGGPPPEITITLCNVTAPKLERWKGNDRYM